MYRLKIHNGMSSPVRIHLSVVISQAPLGGSGGDIILNFPSSMSIPPGNTLANVTVSVRPSAAPGTYTLTNTLST